MYSVSSPDSEALLYQRALALSHQELGTLAASAKVPIPADLRRDKGWVGILLEYYLGARSGNKPQQDFPHLGIELKTIPVDISGRPLESTFVCVAPLIKNCGVEWRSSLVWRKLQRVLWIPIVGARGTPLTKRQIGIPLLWSPSEDEEAQLKQDWEELMDLIVLGKMEQITAQQGEILQLRPKAANGRAKTAAVGAAGQLILTMPRGFYLKVAFTKHLLAHYLQ